MWFSICAPSFVHVVYCNLALRFIALLERGHAPNVSRNLKPGVLDSNFKYMRVSKQSIYAEKVICISISRHARFFKYFICYVVCDLIKRQNRDWRSAHIVTVPPNNYSVGGWGHFAVVFEWLYMYIHIA